MLGSFFAQYVFQEGPPPPAPQEAVDDLGPVARSMVSVNQRLIPMVKANHALSYSALIWTLWDHNKRHFETLIRIN